MEESICDWKEFGFPNYEENVEFLTGKLINAKGEINQSFSMKNSLRSETFKI